MIAAVLLIAPCRAQTTSEDLSSLSLEELAKITVTTASKHEQSVADAPASVSIVTRQEIRKYGYRTLADILRSIRGFYVSYDRNYSYLGVRGFQRPGDYNARILLLVNGHRTNDNIYAQAMLGTEFPIDLDLVERVEIVRGPSSSLYGSNAVFAVVNVITREPRDVDGIEIGFSPAAFGTFQGRATYGGQRRGIDFLLSGTFYDSAGQTLYFPEFDTPETNHGITRGTDYDRFQDFFATAACRGLTFTAYFNSRVKGFPTGEYGTVFNDPRSQSLDSHRFFALEYQRAWKKWQISATTSLDRYHYDGQYLEPSEAAGAAAVLNQDVVWGTLWTGELKVRRSLGRHGLTLGAEFQDNLQADQVNYNLAPFRLFVNSHPGRFTNWSLYAEDEFKLTRRLSANLGVRQDRYPNFGSTTNPRIGLIYHPLPGANLKFLYGSAFRAPTPFETYYYSPGYAANTSLRPETMKTYEVVVENTLGKHVRLTTDFFHNQLRNLIVDFTEANGDVVFRNSEASNATGIEFEVSAALTRGMEMRASYSYARASDERTHLSLTNSPRHLGKFNFHVPISRDKLFAGVGAQYTSERWTLAGHTTSGFPLVNLTLMARNLNSHLDLSASLYNAFNRTFYDPALPGYPLDRIRQDGRSFGFKLTWHSRSEKP